MSTPTSHWSEALGRWLVRRGNALLIILALCLVSGFAIAKRLQVGLPVDFTPQAIFFDDGPALNQLREIEKDFGREDNDVVVLLHGENLQSQAGFDVIAQTHQSLLQSPVVTDVDSLFSAMVASPGLLTVDPRDAPKQKGLRSRSHSLPTLDFIRIMVINYYRARIEPHRERVDDLSPAIDDLRSCIEAVPLPDGI